MGFSTYLLAFVISSLGLILGCFGGGSSGDVSRSYFFLGATLFGSMIYSVILPVYGHESVFFESVGIVLCGLGAIVAGAGSSLAPRCTLAAATAALVGMPLALAIDGRLNPGIAPDAMGSYIDSILAAAVYGVLLGGSWWTLQRSNNFIEIWESILFASAGAWLFALGIDRALWQGRGLWSRVVLTARGRPEYFHEALGDNTGKIHGHHMRNEPALEETAGLILWLCLALGLSVARCFVQGELYGCWSNSRKRRGYSRIPSTHAGDKSLYMKQQQSKNEKAAVQSKKAQNEITPAAAQHASLIAERPSAYNIFDPDTLPSTLERFANSMFASADAIGNFFGFMDDNVRNQAEHALCLLANFVSQQQPVGRYLDEDEEKDDPGRSVEERALRALHAKVFGNYRSWCAALETRPQFSPPAESRLEAGGAATDIILWLCIWGEAANLRHMPECLCFLYHSAAAEWAATSKVERQGDRGASLYQGHWLDTVVAPIYEVVAADMRKKTDHTEKRNYDDFNEFFWSANCLEYHRSAVITATAQKHLDRRASSLAGRQEQKSMPIAMSEHVEETKKAAASALKVAPKTYSEVRTWLHVVFAFQRVYEAHILSFYLLAVLGFSNFLVWEWKYSVQVFSGVAALQNTCAIVWALLESMMASPAMDSVMRASLCARLVTRYVALVFQLTYLAWSFDYLDEMPHSAVRSQGTPAFWFWQHVWLSCILLFGYVLECFLQLWPRAMSAVLQVRGDLARALVALFLPRTSALYVGKTVHEPFIRAKKYHIFWLSLVGWKLYFGYRFLVNPMVAPSVAIYDDYLNYPNIKHRTMKVMVQLSGRWMPSILIYLVDSSIWYSLWAAVIGTYVGFGIKLGVVRDFQAVREAFLLLPRAFCAGLVSGSLQQQAFANDPEGGQSLGALKASNAQMNSKSVSFDKANEAAMIELGQNLPPVERPSTLRSGSDLDDPRAAVAPELRKYFDDKTLERTPESCCCVGDSSTAANIPRRLSPRALGTYISPPSSSTDLAASLGAATTHYAGGGPLAPRLPSFLSLNDVADPTDDGQQQSRGLRNGLVEMIHAGASKPIRRSKFSDAVALGQGGADDEAHWILFAEAWNEVLNQMRKSDTLSNKERDILAFDQFPGFSKPVYLPIFVTAGAVDRALALVTEAVQQYRPLAEVAAQANAKAAEEAAEAKTDIEGGDYSPDTPLTASARQARKYQAHASMIADDLGDELSNDVVAAEAVDELWELATLLVLRLLGTAQKGSVHRDDMVGIVSILDRWSKSPLTTIFDRIKVEDLSRAVLQPLAQLVQVLLKGLPKRKVGVNSYAQQAAASPSPAAALNFPATTPPPTPSMSLANLSALSEAAGLQTDFNSSVVDGEELGPPLPRKMSSDSQMKSEDARGSNDLTMRSDDGKSKGGMKRVKSTSGLASMTSASSLQSRAATDPLSTLTVGSGLPAKYSLSSNKYTKQAGAVGDQLVKLQVAAGKPDAFRDGVRDKVRALLSGVKSILITKAAGQSVKSAQEVSDRLTFVLANERGFFWDNLYTGMCLDVLAADTARVTLILKKLNGLLSTPQRETEPRGHEATRRLTFFVNSLLMDLPPPPPVEAMVSMTTLTPFYAEDVILSKSDLLAKNSDGVTTLLYLQTLYKADWENFLERRRITDDSIVFRSEHLLETRLWASFRAQTLARTVEGMMHCESALRLLARLERLNASRRNKRAANANTNSAPGDYGGTSNAFAPPAVVPSTLSVEDAVKLKFGYVVSCQVYGKQKKNDDAKAKDIDLLLRRFPLLRVAYIDEVRVNRAGAVAFYSVLVKASTAPSDSASGKSDVAEQPIEEIYRIRLPGNPVIGEGKPSNQNHAIIFTRGECLQTIDMNQDGFFEEALKMRNLLQEFRPGAPGVPKVEGAPPTTIVGFREHIFTGSVSSLANYMALQELSFVTLGQRVLDDPLRMRLHYGHPDIFDKLWFATRGGVSKASKGINLSEDIFAGYEAIIRGGAVTMKEYCQVGKGRDVGMQQIYKFEAKLSQGNAEQCLSRDASRMADRLDFPRLLGYYLGGVGHYINSALIVITIEVATYLAVMLCVYGAESIGGRQVVPLGSVQIVLAGLGLLNTLPLLATLTVERGLWSAARDVAQVFLSGGPLYFVFHIQTRSHYFLQTLLAGGASYKATGRGFVTRHSPFDEQYRFFAASHLYLGVELAAALVLINFYTEAEPPQYAGRTWSLWLATIAFLLAPFWFNPLGFSWPHVTDDFRRWCRWISPYTHGGTSSDSWEVWYKEETAVYQRLSVSSKLLVSLKAFLYLALARGLVWKSGVDLSIKSRQRELYDLKRFGIVGGCLLVIALASIFVDLIAPRLHYALHRLLKMILGVTALAVAILAFATHGSFIHLAIALYYVAAAINIIGTLVGVRMLVRHLQRMHDAFVGLVFFFVFIVLSALHIFDVVQTWLLFHNALSQGVVVDDILKQARRSQEADSASHRDTADEIRDLRRMVEQQQRTITNLMTISGLNGSSIQPAETSTISPSVPEAGYSDPSLPNLRSIRSAPSGATAPPSSSYSIELPQTSLPSGSSTDPNFTFQSPTTMPPRELSKDDQSVRRGSM